MNAEFMNTWPPHCKRHRDRAAGNGVDDGEAVGADQELTLQPGPGVCQCRSAPGCRWPWCSWRCRRRSTVSFRGDALCFSPVACGLRSCTTPPIFRPTPAEKRLGPAPPAKKEAAMSTTPIIVWSTPALLLPVITGTIRISCVPPNEKSISSTFFLLRKIAKHMPRRSKSLIACSNPSSVHFKALKASLTDFVPSSR